MKIDLERFKLAFSSLPEGVKEAEVNADFRDEIQISVQDGQKAASSSFSKTVLYLRASNDRTGIVYTEKLDADPLALILSAIENANHSNAGKADKLINSEPKILRKITTTASDISVGQLQTFAQELVCLARSKPGVEVAQCSVRKTILARRVVNSLGIDRYLEHMNFVVTVQVKHIAGKTGLKGAYTACLERLDERGMSEILEQALQNLSLEEERESLPHHPLKAGKHPAVLGNQVVTNIIATAWQVLTGQTMQNGIFSHNPQTKIGSEHLNIIDNPSPSFWAYNLTLDSDGSTSEKKSIVENGKLITPLHSLETADKMAQPPTGNTGRAALFSGTTPVFPVIIPTVIYIKPGDKTCRDLLMEMREGIFITYSLDVFHSINISSGEFSIPCGGIYFKDGRFIGKLDQLTIAGNLKDLFSDITAVGNDLNIEEFYYKNYCYGGPSLSVRSLEIGCKNVS